MVAVLATAVLLAGCASPSEKRADPVVVRWLIGFGTGLEDEQLATAQAVVDRFNASRDEVQIEIVTKELYAGSPEWEDLARSPDAPDLVGPIGEAATAVFADDWAILTRSELGNEAYDPAMLAASEADGGYRGVPVGVYPSMLVANRRIFRDAGQPLPPDRFGQRYLGATWDWEALRRLARRLTVDLDGRGPSDPSFAPDRTETFGFAPHLVIVPLFGQSFGEGAMVSSRPPAAVTDGWRWLSQMIFVDRVTPNLNQLGSDYLANGAPFASGNVGTSLLYSWALPGLGSSPVAGDVAFAVPPSYEGVSQVPYHADRFQVSATTKHRRAAVEAMQFLLNDRDGAVIRSWGVVPARTDLRAGYVDSVKRLFPRSNFSEPFLDGLLSNLSMPSPETAMPLTGADDIAVRFERDLTGAPEPGPDEAIDRFLAALQREQGS